MHAYRPREIVGRLEHALRNMPAVVVTGLRQCGKSTLLLEDPSCKERVYYSLDDFATLAAARSQPESLLESEGPMSLDGVQRCPELLVALKGRIDRRRTKGAFVLSGSANLSLLAGVSESLAGRAVYLTMRPMTRREIRGETLSTPALVRFLRDGEPPAGRAKPIPSDAVLTGGLPPVCLPPNLNRSVWFRGYAQTYVERDVRQLAQVGDLVAFRTLVQLAALRTGQILNTSELGRDARLSAATAGRYLQLLETSFLIERLPPYLKSRGSRLVKSPKLYFTDSGLAAHLAGVHEHRPDRPDPMWGALLETYVVQNVAAILDAHWPEARLFNWHEQGRHEVDLVIGWGNKSAAIEIKNATRWGPSDLASLNTFLDRTPHCQAAILAHNGDQAVQLGKKLWAMPLGALIR
jgi:hypothetical protein